MRTCRKRMFSASAFFFRSAWPFVAPTSRVFMTAKTVTVGTTTYLAPAPDMVMQCSRCPFHKLVIADK